MAGGSGLDPARTQCRRRHPRPQNERLRRRRGPRRARGRGRPHPRPGSSDSVPALLIVLGVALDRQDRAAPGKTKTAPAPFDVRGRYHHARAGSQDHRGHGPGFVGGVRHRQAMDDGILPEGQTGRRFRSLVHARLQPVLSDGRDPGRRDSDGRPEMGDSRPDRHGPGADSGASGSSRRAGSCFAWRETP